MDFQYRLFPDRPRCHPCDTYVRMIDDFYDDRGAFSKTPESRRVLQFSSMKP